MKLDMRGNWLRVLVVPIGVALVASLVTTSAIAAPGDVILTPQHTWASNSIFPSAPFGEGNPDASIKQKHGGADLATGLAVTICDSQWGSINGANGYIDSLGFSRHLIWANTALTVPINPTLAETAVPPSNQIGYLQGSNGGDLVEGHVACPVAPACGDGTTDTGEQCDDGNTTPGDGCSATCTIEGIAGTFQHIWASHHATAIGTSGNGGATLLTKFGCRGLGGCDQFDNQLITICATAWPDLNGQEAYLDDTPVGTGDTSEWWNMWEDISFATPISDPAGSFSSTACCEAGRLSGSPAGVFLTGSQLCFGEAPTFSCAGFDAPMDKTVSAKRKNRILPLKAQLLDSNGDPVTDAITSPPLVQVFVTGGEPTDPAGEDFLPAGKGDAGNQFVLSGGGWDFNLKTSNFSGPGTYTITMKSGDQGEYLIAPTCSATFIIN